MISETTTIPASIDAEKTILGAIMLDDREIDAVRAVLSREDFFLDSHKRIFRRMCDLAEVRQPIDLVTLSEHLGATKELSAIGGASYIASLFEGLPRRISLAEYIAIVKEKSQLRRLMSICESAISEASDQADGLLRVVGRLQDGLETVLADSETDDPLVSAYSVKAHDNFLAERKQENSRGLSYGIPKLDEFTGGMRPGEVTIVGARSGVGKTSLMCQAAAANCQAGIPCHMFSLEMTREQILRRLWAIVSGVPYKVISDPWLSNIDQAARVQEAAMKVAEWPLRIHDQSELHLSKIVGLARVSMRHHGTRFVAVDYAQEVDAEGRDERTKVMAVAKALTRMVKHENASLMLLSQLVKTDRESYNRAPRVGDLIESGKLENVAHLIVLLHRGWDDQAGSISDDAEILVPKQRRGQTGILQAHFNRSSITFEE